MTTVTEQPDIPGGGTPNDVLITVFLAGADGDPLGEAYADGLTVVDRFSTRLSSTGIWSLDLEPNANITPAGTAWGRTIAGRSTNGARWTSTTYADVPSTGGPYVWDDILTDAPATITTSALATHEAATTVDDIELHGVIEHRWAENGWTPFERKIVNQDGAQSFTLSVSGDYGRVTGTGAGDSNQRELLVHTGMRATDGEITAVLKGPSTYVGSNRPQMGLVLRYQEIDGFHVALVVWYDVFVGNPRVLNISAWRGNGGSTLNTANGGQHTVEIARDLRILGVSRFDFVGNFINEYACIPYHLHGLSGEAVTVNVDDDTFDATAQAPSNQDREKGTFQLSETTTLSTVSYKAADGTVNLANEHQRYFPYVLKARIVANDLSVKAWRGRGHEAEPPDWQATTTVATDTDFPTLPSGPGLFGVVAAHAHDSSFMEYGDFTFRRYS